LVAYTSLTKKEKHRHFTHVLSTMRSGRWDIGGG